MVMLLFTCDLIFLILFSYRLQEVAERINCDGEDSPIVLQTLRNTVISQIVVGPHYIALLLEVSCVGS